MLQNIRWRSIILSILKVKEMAEKGIERKIEIPVGTATGEGFGLGTVGTQEKADWVVEDSPCGLRKAERAHTNTGFQEADLKRALEQKKHESNFYYKGKQVQTPVSLPYFKMYGSGIYLFFAFLWQVSLLFLVFSVLSIIPISLNYVKGSAFLHSETSLQYLITKSSIGNYIYSSESLSYQQSINYKIANVVVDIVMSVIFIVFCLYWEIKSDRIVQEINCSVRLLSASTVEMLLGDGQLPREADVEAFMAKFGKVAEVAEVKNYSGLIEMSKSIYDIKLEIKELELSRQVGQDQENARIGQKIKKLQCQLAQIESQSENSQPVASSQTLKYYIQFEKPSQRNNILSALRPYYKWPRCCQPEPPQELLLNGQLPELQACNTEPTGIIWQNVHVTWRTRWLRMLALFAVIAAVVVGGFLLIAFLNVLVPPARVLVDTEQYTWAMIQGESNSTIVESWCIKSLSLSAGAYESVCYQYWKSYIFANLIKIGIAVVIVVLKSLIKIIMVSIAKFQRYQTHTEQSVTVMTNLLITYISTTVLITFLMQANIFHISFKSIIHGLIRDPTLLANLSQMTEYYDLTSNWYRDIGYQIWFNLLILSFVPHLFMPLVLHVMECINILLAKNERMYRKMYEKLRPREFEIEENYANIVMIVIIGFVFAGGQPWMLAVSFLGLITRFLYFRYTFIRFCRVPKTYNEALNSRAIAILKVTLFIRCLISLYMYGADDIFAMEKSAFMKWTQTLSIPLFSSIFIVISRIFLTWYYSMFVAAFILILVFKELLINNLIKLCRREDEDFGEGNKMEESAGEFGNTLTINANSADADKINSQDDKDEIMSQRSLTKSYKLENNPDYIEILAIMKMKFRRSLNVRESISPTMIHNQ